MNREIRVTKTDVGVLDDEQLGLTIEAALIETEDGFNFAVPNVRFEVRVGVRSVFHGTSHPQSGVFHADNIHIDQQNPRLDVNIVANHEGEESTTTVHLRIDEQLERLAKAGEEMRAEEERRHSQVEASLRAKEKTQIEEAERQRKIKADIREAFNVLQRNMLYEPGVRSSLATLVRYDDHPLVQREILSIANEKLLAYFEYFYMASWAKTVVLHIAERYPRTALQQVEQYENMPWAEYAVDLAASKDPELAIDCYSSYQDQGWAQKIYSTYSERARREKQDRKAKERKQQLREEAEAHAQREADKRIRQKQKELEAERKVKKDINYIINRRM